MEASDKKPSTAHSHHNHSAKTDSAKKARTINIALKLRGIDKAYLGPLSIIIGSIIIAAAILNSGNPTGSNTRSISGSTGSNPQAALPTDNNPTGQATAPSANNVEGLLDEDHVTGDRNARILLIEYSDLECPFCKRFHPTAQQLVDSNQGEVAWVYRHFPLDQIHPKARKSAEAVECAAELGGNEAFWALTDNIFEAMPTMTLDQLPALAAQAGLNQNTFQSCLDSGRYANRVESDYQSGISAGVSGTPGNILLDVDSGESRLIPGAVPYAQMQQAVDELLAKQ